MSKSSNLFRKVFLQKKLLGSAHQYLYTYILQYNNISGNDWKKIKDMIHKLQNEEKMNLQVIPSKLRKSLNSQKSKSSLFFSNIEGCCCVLHCNALTDLNIFYKVVNQSMKTNDLNIKLSTHTNSFLHLALQINSKNESSGFLNFLEIQKTISLDSANTYNEFFSVLNGHVTQCISLPFGQYAQIDLILKNQK